jgi:hypothetical protein
MRPVRARRSGHRAIPAYRTGRRYKSGRHSVHARSSSRGKPREAFHYYPWPTATHKTHLLKLKRAGKNKIGIEELKVFGLFYL